MVGGREVQNEDPGGGGGGSRGGLVQATKRWLLLTSKQRKMAFNTSEGS